MSAKKVLVVDDEQDLTALIRMILEEEGYEVYVANNGQEAMDQAADLQPEIILLDYVMPGIKGDEVLDFVNKNPHREDMTIILMSGLGEIVYFKKKDAWKWMANTKVVQQRGELPDSLKWKKSPEDVADEFGVRAFLPKPFAREELLDVLEAVVPAK